MNNKFMIIFTSKDVEFSSKVEIKNDELYWNDSADEFNKHIDIIYVEKVLLVDLNELIKPFI